MSAQGKTGVDMDTAPACREKQVLGNTAHCEHVMQIYDDDSVFLDTLEGFASGGLRGGETLVVIATTPHLFALHHRLKAAGHDVKSLRLAGQYITMDAGEALDGFMVDGYPDDNLFADTITAMIDGAQKGGQRVRAFGEMVALLWAQDQREATIRLEQMWNNVCHEKGLSLFCAYPRIGPLRDAIDSLGDIRALHSHVVVDTARRAERNPRDRRFRDRRATPPVAEGIADNAG